jgi:hypothetical protein
MTITTVNLSSQISHPERTYFERALKRLEQDVLRMGTLVEESFRLSHQSLFENQLENIAKITVLEKQIDQFHLSDLAGPRCPGLKTVECHHAIGSRFGADWGLCPGFSRNCHEISQLSPS